MKRAAIWLERLCQDLRHGVRMFARSPGFAVIAILSIALGTGANVAMFSAVDAWLLRPLPVPNPGEVLSIGAIFSPLSFASSLVSSYPDYQDLQAHLRSFSGLAAYRNTAAGFSPRSGFAAETRPMVVASSNFFDVLGVRLALGRFFGPDEERVAVLSYGLWQDEFSSDPSVLGKTVRINGQDFTVIGVAPESFTGIDTGRRPAAYVPLGNWPRWINRPEIFNLRGARSLRVRGRLAPGASMRQALAELSSVTANLERAYPATNHDQRFTIRTEVQDRAEEDPMHVYGFGILALLAAGVLCVACFNVAGLLSSRGPARAREIALRLAIGAGRWRLIRQLLTESSLIALAGGVLSLPAGYLGILWLRQYQFPSDVVVVPEINLDHRSLLFSVAIAVASVFLFGLVPAIQTTRTDLTHALKTGGAAAGRERFLGRNILVAGQVAISLVLLTVAVYAYTLFHNEIANGPGFRTDHRIIMNVDPGLSGYSEAQSAQFFDKLMPLVRSSPGVVSATLALTIPFYSPPLEWIVPDGYVPPKGQDGIPVGVDRVDESYFETMEIPIVRGRAFLLTDTANSPRVAIVNQTIAERYWRGQDPVGKHFHFGSANGPLVEIVGVARNSHYRYVGEPPADFVYFPLRQAPSTGVTLVTASAGPSTSLIAPLREVFRKLDPDLPVSNVRTMENFYQISFTDIGNLATETIGAMGLMGLALTIVGLYGLMSHAVSRRVREIGIRMAVGANQASVLRMILGQALALAMAGAAAGLALSAATARLLSLYPLKQSIEPRTYFAMTPVLLAVAMLAAWVPARRAASVDPMSALRDE